MNQPQKLGSISPFFIVTDVPRAVRFYTDQLGFEVRFVEPQEAPFFAIVGRDTVQVFLKDISDATDRALRETHAQRIVVKILQFHSFRHYTKAYHQSIYFREQGEWGWWDVPLEKE